MVMSLNVRTKTMNTSGIYDLLMFYDKLKNITIKKNIVLGFT